MYEIDGFIEISIAVALDAAAYFPQHEPAAPPPTKLTVSKFQFRVQASSHYGEAWFRCPVIPNGQFSVVGQIYTNTPVTQDVGDNIIAKVKEALALYYAPANREFGQKPTVMEIVNIVREADSNIAYFDAGSLSNPVIKWNKCDPEYFNPISFARYNEPKNASTCIRIAPECLIKAKGQ